MDTNNQSESKKFSIYNLKFGAKINMVFFELLIFSFVILGALMVKFITDYNKSLSFATLGRIVDSRKTQVESAYNKLLNNIPVLIDKDQVERLISFRDSYRNFESENYDLFDSPNSNASSVNLKEFYNDNILTRINWNKPELSEIIPNSPKEILIQDLYLDQNKNAIGEKYKLFKANDNTSYSMYHEIIHKELQTNVLGSKLNNIYLTDPQTGDIFYAFEKNIAFGTNIYSGILKSSDFSINFQNALSDNNAGDLYITDFNYFLPEYNKPVMFISTPVYYYDEIAAILTVELAPAYLENIIYEDWMFGAENTIWTTIIGSDNKVRTNELSQLTSPEDYFKNAARKSSRSLVYDKINAIQSSALVLEYPGKVKDVETIQGTFKDFYGDEIHLISSPLNLKGLDWNVVVQQYSKSNNAMLSQIKRRIAFLIIALLIISAIVIYFFRNSITRRLKVLTHSIQRLALGEDTELIDTKWKDEIGITIDSFNTLNKRLKEAISFANKLGEGDYHIEFKKFSDSDEFAKSMNTLQERLNSNKLENEKREEADKIVSWTNEGIAKFNDLLRQSNDNLKNLAYIVIQNLVEYLGANQGGVFLIEGETEKTSTINLVAGYAYDRKKYEKQTIEIGEGLLGNCYLERKPIFLKKIPEDYVYVTSGLGKSTPKSLYIIPLINDVEVLGIIEIASLEEIKQYQIDFINKLAENIAATFSTVKLNTKTAELLEESERRTNEIAQQEEEMRQNMEEMQATQEELARLRDEDEKRTGELTRQIENSVAMVQQLVNSMDGEVLLKDANGVILLANEEAAKRFGTTTEKIKGKTDNEIYTPEKAKHMHDLDIRVMTEGIYTGEMTELVGQKEIIYFILKKQFYIPSTKELGVITIRSKRN